METAGVDRLAGADHAIPPAGLAGDRMRAGDMLIAGGGMEHDDDVVARGAERAVSLIGDAHAFQPLPAIERQRFGKLQHVAGGDDRGGCHFAAGVGV
jgi:hypothetical protein